MTMTDEALLAAVAKVAGAKRTDYSDRTPDHWIIERTPRHWEAWNPLTDDGDALRLAVKLGMEVCAVHEDLMATAFVPSAVQGYACDFAAVGGPSAAMRHAIVQAAAASLSQEKPHG